MVRRRAAIKRTGTNKNDKNFTEMIENPKNIPLHPSRLFNNASRDKASNSEIPTWFWPAIATVLTASGLKA